MYDLPPVELAKSPELWLPSRPAIIRSVGPRLLQPRFLPLPRAERHAALKELVARKTITPAQAKRAMLLVPAVGWRGTVAPVTGGFRNSYTDTVGRTTYNFASSDIGSAASDRVVVVAIFSTGSNNNKSISGTPTIDGVNASIAVSINMAANDPMLAIIFANVTTGNSTGTISFTLNAAASRAAIGVWALYNADLSPTTASHAFATTTSRSAALTILDGGFGICGGGHTNTATTGFGWTNATERYDATWGNNTRQSGADLTASATVTATINTNAVMGLVGAAFAPL